MYIYQRKDWAKFRWDKQRLQEIISKVEFSRGLLLGRMESIGFKQKAEFSLNSFSQEIITSSEIEGEILNPEQVRSSIARRLNIEYKGSSNHYVDGIVDMMFDATENYKKPLTKKRLFSWHAALFPTGYSGIYKIDVGKFRTDKEGRMQVVSTWHNQEVVHFEAPEANKIDSLIDDFLAWQKNAPTNIISAAIAHLWFVTIHPFDDGNGRITRAITEMMLAKADECAYRFYSMSNQVQKKRKEYYNILEKTQHSDLDISDWLEWFASTLFDAVNDSLLQTQSIFKKAKFWQEHEHIKFSADQQKMLNKLFDGFEGNLTSSKWAKICKCSQDTASRAIADLIAKGILQKVGSGRNIHYLLNS